MVELYDNGSCGSCEENSKARTCFRTLKIKLDALSRALMILAQSALVKPTACKQSWTTAQLMGLELSNWVN